MISSIIIALIITFHLVSNIVFLKNSSFVFLGNTAGFFRKAASLIPEKGELNVKVLFGNMYNGDQYPPLVPLIAGLFMFVFGLTKETAVLTNIIYMSVLIIATYLIARIYCGRFFSLFAAFIVGMYPGVFGYSRVFLLDLPMTSFITIAVYFLIRSCLEDSVVFSALAGIFIGLALLCRWLVPIYLFPAYIYLILSRRLDIRKTVVSLSVAALVSGIWYIPNAAVVLRYFKVQASIASADSTRFAMNYLKYLYMEQLLIPLFIVSMAAYLYSIVRFRNILFISIITATLIFFSSFANRDPRYVMPIFPFISLLTAKTLNDINYRKTARLAAYIISLYALLQYFLVCYIPNDLSYLKKLHKINRDDQRGYYRFVNHGYWRTYEVLDILTDACREEGFFKEINVLIISPFQRLIYPLETQSFIRHLPLNFRCPANEDQRKLPKMDFGQTVRDIDFVIFKTGYQGLPWHQDYIANMYYNFDEQKSEFEVKLKLPLPDGSKLYVYKNKRK